MKSTYANPRKCLIALLLAGTLVSCATDPVVNAEKVTRTGNDLLDAFVHLERNNQAALQSVIPKAYPQIHAYANLVRRNGVQWLETARACTVAYKNNRSADNKANLDTALAVLGAAIAQSQSYIAQINVALGIGSQVVAPSPTPAATPSPSTVNAGP
jgi:hypothetical protein